MLSLARSSFTFGGINQLGIADSMYNRKEYEDAFQIRDALRAGEVMSFDNIYFDSGSATIKPESYGILDGVARLMRDNPTARIQIAGHTDSDGSDSYNQNLSADFDDIHVLPMVRTDADGIAKLIELVEQKDRVHRPEHLTELRGPGYDARPPPSLPDCILVQ